MSGRCINLPSRNPATARARVDDRVNAREDTRVDAQGAALGVIATISGPCRTELVDGKQRVALRPNRYPKKKKQLSKSSKYFVFARMGVVI